MALIPRLQAGNAWRMCSECGAKLGEMYGHQDIGTPCPYVRGEKGQCTDELKKY